MVEDRNEIAEQGLMFHYGILWPAQEIQEFFPVLKCIIYIPNQEADEGKL